MSAYRKTRTKWLAGIAATCLTLAIALSHEPAIAGATGATDGQAMSIDINVPLNGIKEGQFCQAYALVYNYSGSLTFTWGVNGGQFTNANGSTGPLGANQIVSGNMYASAGEYLTLKVQDATSTVTTRVDFPIGSYDDNLECGA